MRLALSISDRAGLAGGADGRGRTTAFVHLAPSGVWNLWVRLDDRPAGVGPGVQFPAGPGPTVQQRAAALASLGYAPVRDIGLRAAGWEWEEIDTGTGGITLLGRIPVRPITPVPGGTQIDQEGEGSW